MARECQVDLLGRFRVVVAGREVSGDAWRNRRAADLVKLLALAPGHRLSRDRVMAALWPELGGAAAGANLRKAVHFARRAMGSDRAIATTSELVLWPEGRLEVDVDKFDDAAGSALATEDTEAAVRAAGLYRGELLPTDRYEAWTEEPRERLVQRYGRVLKTAELWERVLELDRADEEAHRAIMKRYISDGRRTDAIRQFDRLRRGLRKSSAWRRIRRPLPSTRRFSGWTVPSRQHPWSALKRRLRGLWCIGTNGSSTMPSATRARH
jgi:DNA-binding SARP family transcriptional activator